MHIPSSGGLLSSEATSEERIGGTKWQPSYEYMCCILIIIINYYFISVDYGFVNVL